MWGESNTRGAEIVSKNEKAFIKNALKQQIRIDGRGLYDFRGLRINFGKNFGEVQIQLGRTRVFVATSCEVTEPAPFFHLRCPIFPYGCTRI